MCHDQAMRILRRRSGTNLPPKILSAVLQKGSQDRFTRNALNLSGWTKSGGSTSSLAATPVNSAPACSNITTPLTAAVFLGAKTPLFSTIGNASPKNKVGGIRTEASMSERVKSTDIEIEAELVALGSFMHLVIANLIRDDPRFRDAAKRYFDTYLGAIQGRQGTDDAVATEARTRFLGYLDGTAVYAGGYLPEPPNKPLTLRWRFLNWLVS